MFPEVSTSNKQLPFEGCSCSDLSTLDRNQWSVRRTTSGKEPFKLAQSMIRGYSPFLTQSYFLGHFPSASTEYNAEDKKLKSQVIKIILGFQAHLGLHGIRAKSAST
jgi:hypothetical protein